ncbi:hypothetical protein BG006_003899 [Podila minutissima]|uniref:Uncharacterized protein n=1 Tax=Podila minutissima TaxID=64525 RepID=A0A9P5SLS5_9FUNG|nr:hypothetical protein BG006_003899 [Podila minutissima]
MAPLLATVAAALSAGYYIEGKCQLGKDLNLVRAAVQARKRFDNCIKENDFSLYYRFEEQPRSDPTRLHWSLRAHPTPGRIWSLVRTQDETPLPRDI